MMYDKRMFDEDFLRWIHEMPIGYLQYLWRNYKMSYSDDSDFPMMGDNFTVIPIANIQQLPLQEDVIDQFERLLNEDKITMQDIIGKRK